MKLWYKSKLFWVGVAQLGLALVEYLQTQDWTDWRSVNWPTIVFGILTIVFRWVTVEPITSISPRFDKLRPGVMKVVNGKGK